MREREREGNRERERERDREREKETEKEREARHISPTRLLPMEHHYMSSLLAGRPAVDADTFVWGGQERKFIVVALFEGSGIC
jgi:hypothetical protein